MKKRTSRNAGKPKLRMAGVEVYFEDLARAKDFYAQTLGLDI